MDFSAMPGPQGLYDPLREHDACGVAFVVDAHGRRSHQIVRQGLAALNNMEHRGAAGCEPSSGDGAGILVQMPDAFLRSAVDFALPEPDPDGAAGYACGIAFLPAEDQRRFGCVLTGGHTGGFTDPPNSLVELVRFEVDRAWAWYREGLRLLPLLDRRAAACVAAMSGIYQRLLRRIAADPRAALRTRTCLPTWEKALVAARAMTGATP